MRRAHWRPTVVGVVLTVTGVVSTPAMPMSSQSSIPTATAAQQHAIVEGCAAVLSEARQTGGVNNGTGLPRPPQDKAQLAGHVHDAVDDRPVRDALLVISHPDNSFVQQVLTEDDGMFAFPVIDPGGYTLRIVKPGYKVATIEVRLLADAPRLLPPIRLERDRLPQPTPSPTSPTVHQTIGPGFINQLPRRHVRDEWFVDPPQGRAVPVRGNVADADGLLLGDALVIARNAVGNRRAWQTRTAAHGAYILALGRGVYFIEISRGGYLPVTLPGVRVEGERVQLPSVRLKKAQTP